jgi:Protein kinase domain
MTDDRIGPLVKQWDDAFQQGRDIPADELCKDCPELAAEVAKRIEALKRIEDLINQWQDAFLNDRDIPADELCKDCPKLAAEVAKRIEALKRTAWLMDLNKAGTAGQSPLMVGQGQVLKERYRLDGLIAEGGFGQVWRGTDLNLNCPIAVKVAREDRPLPIHGTDMFAAEGELAAKNRHPRIVAVRCVGRHGGRCFIVSDLITGNDLRRQLLGGPLPIAAAVRIAAEVAEALDHAHQQRVVHRDVKPGNILLDGSGHVFVTDFGIALTTEQLRNKGADDCGTLAYMSPEQLSAGKEPLDHRTDIFSLGVVFYQSLTGVHPFLGESPSALREGIRNATPRTPRSINPAVPREPERICLRCLAKNPAYRYATAQELAKDLRSYLVQQRRRRWRQAVVCVVAGITIALATLNIFPIVYKAMLLSLLGASAQNARDVEIERGTEKLWAGDYRSALNHFDAALASRQSAMVLCYKAEALLGLIQFEDAIECCEKAINLEPKSSKPHYIKGLIYQCTNQREEALKAFRLAKENGLADAQRAIDCLEAQMRLHQ